MGGVLPGPATGTGRLTAACVGRPVAACVGRLAAALLGRGSDAGTEVRDDALGPPCSGAGAVL